MSSRDEFVAKLKVQLDSWNAQIDELEAKAAQASGDTRAKYEEQVDVLRDRQEEARDKLGEIRAASEGAWEELRAGAEDAWSRTKDAISAARDQFKD